MYKNNTAAQVAVGFNGVENGGYAGSLGEVL